MWADISGIIQHLMKDSYSSLLWCWDKHCALVQIITSVSTSEASNTPIQHLC